MGNDVIKEHPPTELKHDRINLKKYMPEKEWWTVWYYICTGRKVTVAKEQN